MKYGDYKKYILMKLGEYNGQAEGMCDDEELKEKLPFALSEAMRFVFYGKNIKKLWHITQDECFSMLDLKPLYKHTDKDIEFCADGAYGYYFEVDDCCDVYIYENGKAVDELHLRDTGYPQFKAFKGLLSGGSIKIIFSGSSFYNIRNMCLYSVRYSSLERIPNFSNWCAHDIPKGLYRVKRVLNIKENGQRQDVPFEVIGGKLMLPRSSFGSFVAESEFFPEVITSDTPDSIEISVPVDTEYLIITKACALLSQEADMREFLSDVEQGMLMLEKENSAEITVKKAGESRWLM